MRKKGFTLVEIMIVVAIIGLLAAIAIPNFMKSRTASQATTCLNNLRQIDHAKEQWASQVGAAQGAAVDRAEVNEFIAQGEPGCPVRNSRPYEYTVIGVHPLCHYEQDAWNDSAVWHALRTNPRDLADTHPAWTETDDYYRPGEIDDSGAEPAWDPYGVDDGVPEAFPEGLDEA